MKAFRKLASELSMSVAGFTVVQFVVFLCFGLRLLLTPDLLHHSLVIMFILLW